MSHFAEVQTQFKDEECLLKALQQVSTQISRSWTLQDIERHEKPQHLYGYQGDRRSQQAHLIIRRQNVQGAANDIGFLRQEDGTYRAIVSDFDRGCGYGDDWIKELSQLYGVEKTGKELRLRGIAFKTEKLQDGTIRFKAKVQQQVRY